MDRGEAVTVFNDLVVLAPGAIPDAAVRWTDLGRRRVRGVFTSGGQTVSAILTFDETDDLVDFVSQDRSRVSSDGKSFLRQTWSTPLRAFRQVEARRVLSSAAGRWRAPEGWFTYVDLEVDAITYNVTDELEGSTSLSADAPLTRPSPQRRK
jgi:hypothetical protein